MTPLTCPEAEAHLDLYAAGECDPPTRAAVEAHLAGCRACARTLDEARRLLALLDARFREADAVERLRRRVAAEPRRVPVRRVLPFLRRGLAAAAMLLVTVGALALLDRGGPAPADTPMVAWASPGAQYTVRRGEISLSEGELWVRSQPAGVERVQSAPGVAVTTPGGVARAEGPDFFVAVRQKAVCVTVREGRVTLANPLGTLEARPGEVLEATPDLAPHRQVEALSLRLARLYRPEPTAVPRAPAAKPPFDLSPVQNYARAAARFPLQEAAAVLKANGFAALPGDAADLGAAYHGLRERDVPVVLTADAVLLLCRGHLAATLADTEERVLAGDLAALARALLDNLDGSPLPADTDAWRQARALALGYVAVGLRALEPKAALPRSVDEAAVEEAVATLRRAGRARLRLLGRAADFTLDSPQGHYLRSETLQRYHAAMTWFGRTGLLLRGDGGRSETLAAVLLTRALSGARLSDGRAARDTWSRICAVTGFLAGLSDDLGPQQYHQALARVGVEKLVALADPGRLRAFQVELAKQAAQGNARGPTGLLERLPPDAGFRLFGRRSTPDGPLLGRLVAPAVGPPTRSGQFTLTQTADGRALRGLPRGLDLMAALGSSRARELLRASGDDAYRAAGAAASYDEALASLRRELGALDAVDWNRNLSWAWLYALRPLLEDRGTPGARTRTLNTALSAWALGRRDVALYAARLEILNLMKGAEAKAAKEPLPSAPVRLGQPEVHVEPVPELYGRLRALVRMTEAGLSEMSVLDPPSRDRLGRLARTLETLHAVAAREVAGRAADGQERAVLASLVAELEGGEDLQAASVVTIHTDANSGQVMQAATGRLDVGLFLFRGQGGRLRLGAGPVLSYYEFRRARETPLTEAEWGQRLRGRPAPERPGWAAGYLVSPRGPR